MDSNKDYVAWSRVKLVSPRSSSVPARAALWIIFDLTTRKKNMFMRSFTRVHTCIYCAATYNDRWLCLGREKPRRSLTWTLFTPKSRAYARTYGAFCAHFQSDGFNSWSCIFSEFYFNWITSGSSVSIDLIIYLEIVSSWVQKWYGNVFFFRELYFLLHSQLDIWVVGKLEEKSPW